MNIFSDYLYKQEEFKNLDAVINNDNFQFYINNFSYTAIPFFANYIKSIYGKKSIFIVSEYSKARTLYKELKKYSKKTLILENEELKFYQIDAINRKNEFSRIKILRKIYENDFDFLVITMEAVIRKYTPVSFFKNAKIDIEKHSKFDLYSLIDRLINLGYYRTSKVEGEGQFSVRGSIIDIFSPNEENPIRIEFFGDEIDSIREFNIYSQISIKKIEKFTIINAREYLYPENIEESLNKIKQSFYNEDNLSSDLENDFSKLEEKFYFKGIERYIDFLYKEQSSILDYINKKELIFVVEPNNFIEKYNNLTDAFLTKYEKAYSHGFAISEQKNIILKKDFFLKNLIERNIALISEFIINDDILNKFKTINNININIKNSKKYLGKIEELIADIKKYKEQKYTILISLYEDNVIEKLIKTLKDLEISVKNINDNQNLIENTDVYIKKSLIENGFILEKSKFIYISNNDIFYKISNFKPSTTKVNKTGLKMKKIDNFIDLKKGDIVVHEIYGIGKFIEVIQKENNGIKKDFIKILYKDNDYIFVPINQMDKVQKYIGKSKETISLTKLGSSKWKQKKAKAKKAVEKIAQYLVELYAKREKEKGFAFSKDTLWQREFESYFPFEETIDQLNAIREVKIDMEKERPMDRLLCGDVGFGKTEVALRAMFKACMDGKQVACLVPTTILAQQHYDTISERFYNFPLNVDVLSRFKTKKQQTEIIEKLKKGEVDVIIGTHRLLSKDIAFKDLGLLVIDEEQRFGVKDKEKIKTLKSNIDVLTLTATPIPRTLNISLSGIRDMSIINNPPRDRNPVITYVTEAREGIILDAIEREVSRGGQVFFVYNSIEDIYKMKDLIYKLMPDINIAVAHGRMTPGKLEEIMVDYLEKKYDVLISTTIIETGMDISNANTIIIYNADKMGLSQLYQLRGRVGRSSKQAYAYLMYEKNKVLTEIQEKKLKTIRDFTEFGSGFKVAMMDLELRGSGNILGETQSGHIEEIGYDLYIKMLNDSLKKLKGIDEEDHVITEVYINVNAYISNTYIEDENQKIEIYKKISAIFDKEDYFSLQEELKDRFSNIPVEVENLLKISYIRSLGQKLNIEKIVEKNQKIFYINKNEKLIQKISSSNEVGKLLEIINFLEKLKLE